ncbi:leucine-rich repeat protein [Bacteroides eggerthii]|uniref:leucine-rich repeat protein n=1 Tax=Bacteroides eggerthii TaxID=28111 RepID=UPI0035645EB6
MKVLRFIRLILLFVITSLSFTACNEDSNSTAPIFVIDSSLEKGLTFSGEGGEQSINFTCSMDWILQISSPNNDIAWCTPSITRGKAGNYIVKFAATKNTEENKRFVYVNIFAGTSAITFIITQHTKRAEDDVEKPTINLSQERFNVETRGGTIKVDVESNVQYMIQIPNVDWVTEVAANTKASNSHYFAISENPLLIDRNADILFVTQELDTLATIGIEQKANNFITVNSTSAGSLLEIIGAEHIEDVTGLKVIGDINGNDIVLIKRMTNLIKLDLSQSRIVEGGVSYGKKDILYTIPVYVDDEKYPQVDAYTEDDIIGENMFENCNFREIKLPNSLVRIDARAFKNCFLLQSVNIPESMNYISWFAF